MYIEAIGQLKKVTFILCLFCLSNFASAESAASQQSMDDARKFLNQYVNHFNKLLANPDDMEALEASAGDMSFPAIWINSRGNLIAAENQNFVKKDNSGFINYLRKQGIQKIRWKKVELQSLGDKTIIASNIASLIGKNGKIVRNSSGTYLMHFKDGKWRLFSRIQHPVEDRIQQLNFVQSRAN